MLCMAACAGQADLQAFKAPDSFYILLLFICYTDKLIFMEAPKADPVQTFWLRLGPLPGRCFVLFAFQVLHNSLALLFLSPIKKGGDRDKSLWRRGNPSDPRVAPCPSCISSVHFKVEGKWRLYEGHPPYFLLS